MTIQVSIKPRQDNRFDIWVTAANGDVLLNSSQGYENVEDAERVAWLLFGAIDREASRDEGVAIPNGAAVELTVTYRDGTGKTERLR